MASVPADPGARRLRWAWLVAIAADVLQNALLPVFAEGWLSPANDALDLVVSLALLRLLGWHPALLPTLLVELVPGVDLLPTWSAAVAVVALSRRARPGPPAHPPSGAEVVPDEPAVGDAPPQELPPAR